MQELFKGVVGYESIYKISNLGNVMSYKSGKFLTPVYRKGYATVTLCKNGKSEIQSIHRLVAQTFIPNPDKLPVVNHIDGNKENNNVNNLEWCTQLDNVRHAFNSGLINRKPLTDEQKRHISIKTREAMNNPLIRQKISDSRKEAVYRARTI